ncbi:MAG TPA: undecaprenyldiphospho-muramoylpentapeptide beta-N-acetylglucosaminyltransferase [Clostridia bacterium]|nr:undecaprenyldiphospho-muramoylpentapeptide beta-N-acetylglucosaminyltransferase [Clostridia bacterium]
MGLKVVLTGGGTGGHIYPAVAVGRRLLEVAPGAKIYYVGTSRGLEKELVPKEGWPFYTVAAAGLARRISPATVKALLTTGKGYLQARGLLQRLKPDLVLGTGGYVCGPVVLAGAHLGIPTMIHEQNAYPGLTNRWLARVAGRVCITFPQSAQYFPAGSRIVETGLPIRRQILETTREEGLRGLGLKEGFRVLVVGGSQGAKSINLAMLDVYDRLKERRDIHWLHITGQAGYEGYLQELAARGIDLTHFGNITIMPYVYQMEQALSVADLVIGRAGASFLAEVTAKGLPGILIPYPFASENHQEYNAKAVVESGGAILVKEKDLSGPVLAEHIIALADHPERLARMARGARALGKPDAVDRIIEQVFALTGKTRRI